MTRKEIARSFSSAFEHGTRDNGEQFAKLKEGSPEWMSEALFAAHDNGELLPNDWSYRMAEWMADHIADALEYDADAELSDIVLEGSDSLIPAYNGQLLDWLASHLNRASYVDDAVAEYGWPSDGGIFQAIACGMATELQMIGSAIAGAIEAESEES